MDNIELVKPELLILIPVLNALGMILKKSRINNCSIPIILGFISILLCAFHSYSISPPKSWIGFIYENISQGLLIAAASVYSHQIYTHNKKQAA